MKAKDFLLRAWQADARIECRIEERERLKTRLRDCSDEIEALEESERWRLEAEAASLSQAIQREILAMCRAKREVNAAIEAVEDGRYRWLLELRYRNYMTWEAIADEMEYELRHIYRLHRGALAQVERLQREGKLALGSGDDQSVFN